MGGKSFKWQGFPHACGDGPVDGVSVDGLIRFSPRVWGWSAHGVRGLTKEPRFPHACGDGPNYSQHLPEWEEFSPRVWGWSGEPAIARSPRYVFPTRVGMVRAVGRLGASERRFPHACGDGPASTTSGNDAFVFSPRVWGWSVVLSDGLLRLRRFPHACGDGPHPDWACNYAREFSPRVWGWSVRPASVRLDAKVFPTRVGMVRTRQPSGCGRGRFPHACGDGPSMEFQDFVDRMFSPRVWGWSVIRCDQRLGLRRFPHACGDGPKLWDMDLSCGKFSPRVWGWSAAVGAGLPSWKVFPTRVGMVRCWWTRVLRRWGFPRACGDGPFSVKGLRAECLFSPRVWGWSADSFAKTSRR